MEENRHRTVQQDCACCTQPTGVETLCIPLEMIDCKKRIEAEYIAIEN